MQRPPVLALVLALVALPGSGAVAAESSMSTQEAVDLVTGADGNEHSLPAYWAEHFGQVWLADYHDPWVIDPAALGQEPSGPCRFSAASVSDNATYCTWDATIAYDPEFLDELHASHGPAAPMAVLAHEWGHHIQALASFPWRSVRKELQADCFAGAYLASVVAEGLVERESALLALSWVESDGGSSRVSLHEQWTLPIRHGHERERRQAFGVGFASADPAYCDAFIVATAERPIRLSHLGAPSRTLRPLPGSIVRYRGDGSGVMAHGAVDVHFRRLHLDRVRPASEVLSDELATAFDAGPLELGVVVDGWLEADGRSTGAGARADVELERADGEARRAAAAVQVHDDGLAELVLAIPRDRTLPSATPMREPHAAARALEALAWGYCDRAAPNADGCRPA